MNKLTTFSILNLGFKYLKKNFKILLKEFGIPVLLFVFGTYLIFQPILQPFSINSLENQFIYPSNTFFCLLLGTAFIIYGTWKALCSCVLLIYSLKENQNPIDYNFYKEKFNIRKCDFKIALKTLGKYYFCFLIPYILIIILAIFFALIGQPMLHWYLLPIGCITYFIIFFILIHFAIKTFYFFQIFAIEENLNPKEIIKRCYEFTKGHFWFTFRIGLCLTLISLIPAIISIGAIMAFVLTFIITFALIPITIVAGYYGYKKINENIK